jgi:hypothetical protein
MHTPVTVVNSLSITLGDSKGSYTLGSVLVHRIIIRFSKQTKLYQYVVMYANSAAVQSVGGGPY